ncbi:MAG TPA: hypothetical protein VNZ45_15145 [Bacteroidia bacterium]|jgi:hypothetical protein|nr:hypothetical protein [Bacteroidia bacterium]
MKTLFVAISFTLISIGAFSQTTATKAPAKKGVATPVEYKCPMCGATSAKAGDCSKDKIAMVKEGDYYCPDCYMSSAKPGKCSMCGVDMKKMEASAKK